MQKFFFGGGGCLFFVGFLHNLDLPVEYYDDPSKDVSSLKPVIHPFCLPAHQID